MGFSLGIIAIKGDHSDKVAEIFNVFNYIDNSHNKTFYNWDQISEHLFNNYVQLAGKDIALRGIWIDNGWTMICDPELVDPTEEDKLEKLSHLLNTEVWTFLIQTTSDTYAFSKYNPSKVREFWLSKGRYTQSGTPLPEEKGFNMNEKFCVGEIAAISQKVGINLTPTATLTFTAKELDYNDELKAHLEKLKLG